LGYYDTRPRETKSSMLYRYTPPEGLTITKSRLAGRNTLNIWLSDGTVIIRLYETNILEFTPRNTVILRADGYVTQVTRDRINEHIYHLFGIAVEKDRDKFHVRIHPNHWNDRPFWDDKIYHYFYDGIEIRLDTRPPSIVTTPDMVGVVLDFTVWRDVYMPEYRFVMTEYPHEGVVRAVVYEDDSDHEREIFQATRDTVVDMVQALEPIARGLKVWTKVKKELGVG